MKRKIYISLLFLVFAASMNAQSWPRFFWNQIVQSDSTGSLATAGYDNDGYWNDSLRFMNGQLSVNGSVDVSSYASTKIYNYNSSTSTLTATNVDEFSYVSTSTVNGAFELLFSDGNIDDTRFIIEGTTKSFGSATQSTKFYVDFDIVTGDNVVGQQTIIVSNKFNVDTVRVWYNQSDTLGVFIGSIDDQHIRPYFSIDRISVIGTTESNAKAIINSATTSLRTSEFPTNGDIVALDNGGTTASKLAENIAATKINADIFNGPHLVKNSSQTTINLPLNTHLNNGAAGAIEINLNKIQDIISYSGKVQIVVDVMLQDFSYTDLFQQSFTMHIDAYMLSGNWNSGTARIYGKWLPIDMPVKIGSDASGKRCIWIGDTSYDPFRRFVILRSISFQTSGTALSDIEDYWSSEITLGLATSLNTVTATLTTHLPYSSKLQSTSTGQEVVASGNTSQRETISIGAFRVNTDSSRFEGSADGSTWVSFPTLADINTSITTNVDVGEIAIGSASGLQGYSTALWNDDILFIGDTTGIFTGLGSDNEYKLNSFGNVAVFNGKIYTRELNLSGSFPGIQFHNPDNSEGYEDIILQHETSNNKLFWKFEEGTSDWLFFEAKYDSETIELYGKVKINDDLLVLDPTTTANRHTGVLAGLSWDTDEDKPVFYDGTSYQLPIWESEEESGNTTGSTDASGDIVISHSLGSSPSVTVANAGIGGVPYIITWISKTSTNVTFRIYKNDGTGAAASTGTFTIDYIFKK